MKIVTTCGMGFGTSLMLLMDLQAIGKKHNITITGEAVDSSSVKGIPADAIFGSSEIINQITDTDTPLIGIQNILDKEELERKLLEFIRAQHATKG